MQAWGVLEEGVGDTEKARQLFRAASKADARMVHVWQAWGMLELRCGNFAQARKLFQSAVWCSAASSDVCRVWQVNLQPCMRTTHHNALRCCCKSDFVAKHSADRRVSFYTCLGDGK